MGVVTVVLEKIDNLVDRDRIGKSDPYVKFELEQDRFIDKSFGKKKSTKKRNELNPVYNEIFIFEDVPSLKNMRLNVYIMDSDIGLDDCLGSIPIMLEAQNLGEAPRSIQFPILCKGGTSTLFLKLSYIAAK